MRSLEKEPEARWPTADALRRALESRSAPPYRPAVARAPVGGGQHEAKHGFGAPPARMSAVVGHRSGAAQPGQPPKRMRREISRRAVIQDGREVPDGFVSWASVCGGLTLIDLIQGGGLGWSLFVTVRGQHLASCRST